MLATWIGSANIFAEPVVVHLVDIVDQDEARLGVVVGGRHDEVPQAPRLDGAVHPAGDQALVVDDVVALRRPLAPDDVVGRVHVEAVGNVVGQAELWSSLTTLGALLVQPLHVRAVFRVG